MTRSADPNPAPASLRIEGDLRASFARPLSADQRRAREALGIRTDRPIIMTGHQAELWHAGIFAKFALARELAERCGGACAFIIADQDNHEPLPLMYPARRGDSLSRGRWPARFAPTGLPTGSAPGAAELPALPDDFATDAVRAGLERARAALLAEPVSTLAGQFWRATARLLPELIAPSDPALFATRLASGEAFAPWLEALARDPERCVRAYNAAAQRVPEAGMTPLTLGAKVELPLWRVQPGRARQRVFADQLASIPRDQLAPRALLMTAFLRACACDVFIHGLGGGVYDRVTDLWLAHWQPEARLAPTLVATATLHIPLPHTSAPAVGDIHRAVWAAHHARHELPSKAELLREIESAPDKARRQAIFQRMQALLRDRRAHAAAELARAEEHARAMRDRLGESSIVFDRTWPFVLHTPEALAALRVQVRQRVESA